MVDVLVMCVLASLGALTIHEYIINQQSMAMYVITPVDYVITECAHDIVCSTVQTKEI